MSKKSFFTPKLHQFDKSKNRVEVLRFNVNQYTPYLESDFFYLKFTSILFRPGFRTPIHIRKQVLVLLEKMS